MLFIPKQNNLILFGSWFGNRYADNSKYMYEYMLNRKDLEIYWYTRNRKIYQRLKQKGKPVLLSTQPRAIWKQIRAHILVSTIGFTEFNTFFLCKCVFLDLDHGSPIKASGFDQYHINKPLLQTQEEKRAIAFHKLLEKDIEHYKFSASEASGEILKNVYQLPPDKVLNLGRPRNDLFYDATLRHGRDIPIKRIKGDKKAIVYMPTHRSEGKCKIRINKLMDLPKVQQICEEYNYIFLIKKHYYHRHEKEDISKYSNIRDITNKNIDPQILLYEADVLITDYSACFVDYLLLNRPIIYYPYDIDEFIKNEREMYLPYADIAVGTKAYNKDELSLAIENTCKRLPDQYADKRAALCDFYFSKQNQRCVREQIADYINNIIVSQKSCEPL